MLAAVVVVVAQVGPVPATAAGAASRRTRTTPAPAAPTTTTLPSGPPPARSWVLVDDDTGRVLGAQDEHLLLPPASLSKLVTALVAVAWLRPTDTVAVSARDATVYPNRVGMAPGQTWTLDEVLHTLLIYSANDAAYALAERISPTVEDFAGLMGLAAARMGMTDHPIFHDPAGLDGTEGIAGGNLASARDLAIVGRDLLAQPYLASIVALTSWTFTAPSGVVTQILSENRSFLHAYPGATGVKTGYTDPAGPCIIASATRAGRTMLAVVMNGSADVTTAQVLLDRGFATPVAQEPTGNVLPSVHLPSAPHPVTLPGPSRAGGVPRASAAITGPRAGPGIGAPWPLSAGGALVVVGAAAVMVSRRRRPRRSVGAHTRRPWR